MSIWGLILVILAIGLPFVDVAIGLYYGIYINHYNKKMRDLFANSIAEEVRDGKQ